MTTQISRVAVLGAGAMGGMYAAHFAKAGFDVRFVASGERAKHLETGVVVNGEPLKIPVVDASASLESTSPWRAELVIFAVKDGHLDDAIADARSVIDHGSVVLSVLNGLDSEERIAAGLESQAAGATVLLCIAMAMDAERVSSEIHFRQVGKLVFGDANNETLSAEVLAVQDALDRAGLAWETPVEMRHRLWWKFMVNVGINQASAVLDAPYGDFQHEGDARSLMSALIDEVIAVAGAEGIALGEADVAAWHRVLAGQPAAGRTSMHQDVLAGRPTEVETFGGRVVALGERHGIPTPYNQTVTWILRGRGAAR